MEIKKINRNGLKPVSFCVKVLRHQILKHKNPAMNLQDFLYFV